jgi:hypothetical protein
MLRPLLELAGFLLLLSFAALLLWASLSPFAFAAIRVAERLRLPEIYGWAMERLKTIKPLASFTAGYRAVPSLPAGAEAKLIVDERLTGLRHSLRRSVDSIKGASASLLALGGAKGPGAVAKDIRALQDRVEDLADLGGEIPEEISGHYQLRAKTVASLGLMLFFFASIAIANGTLLNQFFKDLIPGHFLGIRLSYLVSVVVICGEAALGYLVYQNREKTASKWLFILLIAAAALMESLIFGFMSYGFDFDVPFLDDYPALKFWMSPFGLILVASTAGLGFEVHAAMDELSLAAGAKRLRREIRTLNSLVRDLPDHWERIRSKADAAAASIAEFQSALGGRQGALAGAIEKIAVERSALEQSLVDAHLENWPQWLGGEDGDRARKKLQQVALAIATLLAFGVFAVAMEAMLGRAFRTWEEPVLISAALGTGAAFYIVGWQSFERIQLLGDRVFPLRAGTLESIVAGIAASAAILAIVIAGWRVGGTSGFAYALLLVAAGGVLATLGYAFDDAVKGLALAGRFLAALLIGAGALLVAALAHLLGWIGLAILGATWLLVALLAWPLEQLLARRSNRPVAEPVTPAPRRKLRPVA